MAVSVRITFFRFINHRPSSARSFPIHAAGIVQATAHGDRQLGRRPSAAGRHRLAPWCSPARPEPGAADRATNRLGHTTNRGSRDRHRRTCSNTYRAEAGLCFGETVSDSLPVTERIIETNGVQLHTVEAGEPGAPVVVLAHGFPELAYSWRHQIPALAAAGYHVLAPDQRGYGRTTRPADIADYNVADLSADLIGLLDDVGADKAVFVGHDWGAQVAWGSAQLHPDRVAAVVGLSVPPVPRAHVPPTQAFRAIFGDNFFYMLYFQHPGVADAELDADPAKTLRRVIFGQAAPGDQAAAMRMLRPGPEGLIERIPEPDGLPSWISADELDHYVAEFSRTGFTGGLNW